MCGGFEFIGEGRKRRFAVFASYSHGCLLPKNPKLADLILQTALERKYGNVELSPLADEFETAAHNYMEARLSRK